MAHSIHLIRNNSLRGLRIPLVSSRISDDALYRLLNTLHLYIPQLNIKISDHQSTQFEWKLIEIMQVNFQ